MREIDTLTERNSHQVTSLGEARNRQYWVRYPGDASTLIDRDLEHSACFLRVLLLYWCLCFEFIVFFGNFGCRRWNGSYQSKYLSVTSIKPLFQWFWSIKTNLSWNILPGIENMPNVRDHDLSVYLRLQGNGLSIGGYEPHPDLLPDVSFFKWGCQSPSPTTCTYPGPHPPANIIPARWSIYFQF